MRDYKAALMFEKRALNIRLKIFGYIHERTADCYWALGVTQNAMHDYKAALHSHQRALAIRIRLFGEEHESTADSYTQVKIAEEVLREDRNRDQKSSNCILS